MASDVPNIKVTRFGSGSSFKPVISKESISGWTFESVSAPIASIERTAEVETELGLPTGVPLPEALFADNCVRFTHEASNLTVAINAVGALRSWHSRQQGYAAEHSEADEDSVISATSFDWTYRNEYSGDVTLGPMTGAEVMSGSGVSAPVFAVSETGLPMRELQRREDILWSCSLSLFEDDLHDKGVVECTVKARVMPSCFLVLLRTFLRLDGDSGWLRETRFAHVFGSDTMVRDVQLRSVSAQEMAAAMGMMGGPMGLPPAAASAPMHVARAAPPAVAGMKPATALSAAMPSSAVSSSVASSAASSSAPPVLSTSPFAPSRPPSTRAVAYDAESVRMATKAEEHVQEECKLTG